MSLIVARNFDDEIRIISDGKISDPNQLDRGPLYGSLKAVILDSNNCVCYAGLFNLAIDAIRHLLNKKLLDYISIKNYLLKVHIENNNQTDFIIGNILDSIKLCKISNGMIEEDINIGWIGDFEAFSEYQKLYHNSPTIDQDVEEKLITYSKMASAMQELVIGGKCISVGDFWIGVRSGPTGFNYLTSAIAFIVKQTIPPNTPTKLRFGTAAEGGYAYTILTPNEIGIGAIGILYSQGNLGALFYPLRSDRAITYNNVNYETFRSRVRKDYGFLLEGLKIG